VSSSAANSIPASTNIISFSYSIKIHCQTCSSQARLHTFTGFSHFLIVNVCAEVATGAGAQLYFLAV